MPSDVLILNSGEWELSDELPAVPWHILVYRQKRDRRNELHVWFPRESAAGERGYAFKRYWHDGEVRWCVEIPSSSDRFRTARGALRGSRRFRFMAHDGRVLWAESQLTGRLGDFTDAELLRLRREAAVGPYTLI